VTLPIEAVQTLEPCWECRGDGRLYCQIGTDWETGSAIEASCECPTCCGLGATPVLAGWDADENPPEDETPEYDPADAPMFVESAWGAA